MALHYSKENDLKWKKIKNAKTRGIELVVPPAWKNVLICPDPENYIQAIGIDNKGRKQYIYHPDWIKKSQEKKFDQLIIFGERLPTLRKVIKSHMREHQLTQNRVIATVIWLLEHTFIRVGNKTYAEENESYGLTTMREKHIKIKGDTVTFSFKGKSNVFHELDVTNLGIVKTIKECIDLPGYEIFQYIDEDNSKKVVDAQDVNDYMREFAGVEFSAKDFRTWGGSVLAGKSLYKKGSGNTKDDIENNVREAVKEVSVHLGNTKKVCRTYYIHPTIINSYQKDILVPHFKRSYGRKSTKKLSLSPEEYATWSLIKDY